LRDRYRRDLSTIHSKKMNEISIGIDDSNIHFPITLLCLYFCG
jgi:hypothetical protein